MLLWVTIIRRAGWLIPLAEEPLGWREKHLSSRISATATSQKKARPRNFLHCFHTEQPLWIPWVSDRALEIQLIWTPKEAEGRRSSLSSSEMLMLSSKNRLSASHQSFILMIPKGRDKNLQSTQIRRDIIDGEQKYYKPSATLCNERQCKHYHFLITATTFIHNEVIFK